MAEDSHSVLEEAHDAGEALAAAAQGPPEPPTKSKWYLWRKSGTALVAYLLDSEVHTFAFSVAANAIISFIPFAVLLYTLALSVFHSQAMKEVVDQMVNYYLPSAAKTKDWLVNTIVFEAVLPILKHKSAQALSVVMILIACTGIFLPLEVALNQAWGVAKSRNYLFNQAIAFGLAILMAVLALLSMSVTVWVKAALGFVTFHSTNGFITWTTDGITSLCLTVSSGAAAILFLFSVYYVLPNRKVPWRPVLRISIITGLIWLLARFLFALAIPHIDLSMYGPFYVSVSLLFWAYISGLILFAGAQFSVARWGNTGSSK
ncbi:MAG: YihY/virulence factor BrkB family protein [Terracidiphilus sp.]|nr:YihY/virulence factor BrkB family protein [Terracidiphilus sp.]MDR3798321.1 YihY/virulence factor BrkB family protein [Terracidiphilus sp.]